MLPKIVEIASKHQLQLKKSSLKNIEVHAKCPFCLEDSKPNKRRKYYLSLNSEKDLFKCWFCKEGGGVLRFIALLEGVAENEVVSRFRRRKIIHPAENLTMRQRRMLAHWTGSLQPDWQAMKKRDREYYLRTLDMLLEDWNYFVDSEVFWAYYQIAAGIELGRYSEYVDKIKQREIVIGAPLLNRALKVWSSPKRPSWAKSSDDLIQEILKKSPVRPETAKRQA